MATDDKSKKGAPSETGGGRFQFSPGSPSDTASGSNAPKGPSPKDMLAASLDTGSDSVRTPTSPGSRDDRSSREQQRLPVSFPGLLKLLIPEISFVPTTAAVRVANLSIGGAMIEVHDRAKLDKEVALANRFFELKVAHPDVPLLRGTVAWSDFSGAHVLIGLSCFEPVPELAEIVKENEQAGGGVKPPPPLPAPKLEPFPPFSANPTITIYGQAPEAVEVVARGDERKFAAAVTKGRFELLLELDANGENHFSLRSYAGTRKSRAVPIRVVRELASDKRGATGQPFAMETSVDKEGLHTVELEFNGNVRQAERILYRFSQLLAISETMSMHTTLRSHGEYDKRLCDALASEGRMMAADTGRMTKTAKLLDELM